MPKTATGKRAGQKKVTNILMNGLGKVTEKLVGDGTRQMADNTWFRMVDNGKRLDTMGIRKWVKLRSTAWKA